MKQVLMAALSALALAGSAFAGEPVDFRLTTDDGYDLAARFFVADEAPDAVRPTLILVHGAGVSKERWEQVEFVEELNREGWHVLTFDIRGRGDSQALPEGSPFAPPWEDISTAVEWAQNDERVDTERLALVGESFGANLIVTGMRQHPWPVETFVSLSATRVVFLWPIEIRAHLQNALYVGSTGDPYPAVDGVAEVLEALTQGETRSIVADERSHGVGVLVNPQTRAGVMDWLRLRLANPE